MRENNWNVVRRGYGTYKVKKRFAQLEARHTVLLQYSERVSILVRSGPRRRLALQVRRFHVPVLHKRPVNVAWALQVEGTTVAAACATASANPGSCAATADSIVISASTSTVTAGGADCTATAATNVTQQVAFATTTPSADTTTVTFIKVTIWLAAIRTLVVFPLLFIRIPFFLFELLRFPLLLSWLVLILALLILWRICPFLA